MIDSVRTSFDVNETTATNMLQHWSKVVKDDFRQNNTVGVDGDNDNNNLLRRRNFQDQLLKVNANVAVHLTKLIDMQVQFDNMSLHLNNVSTEVNQLNHWKVRVTEQNDKIIDQQRQILELLRSNRGNATPASLPQQRQAALSEVTPPTEPPLPPLPPADDENSTQHEQQVQNDNNRTITTPPTPININDRLQRQIAYTAGTRGKPKPNTSMLEMLNNWYQDPDSECYRSLRRAGPALDDQQTWVLNKMFKMNRRDLPKIKRCLQFLDALWTKEERDKIIYKKLGTIDAYRLHEAINKRIIKFNHLLKEPMPRNLEPQANAKSNMQGLGNSIQQFKLPFPLEHYVPNWQDQGKIKAPETLMEVGINRLNKIRTASKNTYRRNDSTSGTGLAAASAIANRARQEAARLQARTQRVDPGPLLPAAAAANNNSIDGDSRPI